MSEISYFCINTVKKFCILILQYYLLDVTEYIVSTCDRVGSVVTSVDATYFRRHGPQM